jgi:hypothetical protein
MDDIPVYSQNMADHLKDKQTVLKRLGEHHLFLKPQKCAFAKSALDFCCYTVSGDGVAITEDKVRELSGTLEIRNVRDLRVRTGIQSISAIIFYC